MQELKKEFQKVVARIRAEQNATQERKSEYPKAMMTGQQQAKGTATINCSGSSTLAAGVINHPAIVAFLRSHNATAAAEAVNYGGWTQHQIRINFPKAADKITAEVKRFIEAAVIKAMGDCDNTTYEEYIEEYTDQVLNNEYAALVEYARMVGITVPQELAGGANNG